MIVIIRQYTGAREDFPRDKTKYVDTVIDGVSELSASYDENGTLDADIHTDMDARTTYHDAHTVRALAADGSEIQRWDYIPVMKPAGTADLHEFDGGSKPDLKAVT